MHAAQTRARQSENMMALIDTLEQEEIGQKGAQILWRDICPLRRDLTTSARFPVRQQSFCIRMVHERRPFVFRPVGSPRPGVCGV